MMRGILSKILSLVLLGGLAAAVMAYPANKIVLGIALGAYVLVLWWRPALWLLAVPALLPILDFAPWTGWFFLEELDLLLLATGAIGYWRLGASRPEAELPPFLAFSLGLVSIAFTISAVVGLFPLSALDANAFTSYLSNYNSLRVAKGLVWALLLLPLLRRSAGPDMDGLLRYFVPGMLLGLVLASLAVVWERAVFPGVLNFSSDYRPTAPFSAMHTGGAALDAYLAISFPFVAVWLLGAKSRLRLALAPGVLLLGCYAGFATFSRDMYLAYAGSVAVLGALVLGHRLRRGRGNMTLLATTAALLALSAYALSQVFATSGYRGLAAALMVLGAAVVLSSNAVRLKPVALSIVTALLLLLLDAALFSFLEKGAYLAFGVSAALLAAGALLVLSGPEARKSQGLAMAAGAFPGVAVSAALVATHWGGKGALGDMAILVALALGMVALNRLRPAPLWQLDRPTLTLSFFSAIVFATVIPISSSYYLGSRFATVGSDVDTRLRHWSEALDMMTPDWQTSAVGMGLGRYPSTYFWKNNHGEIPGSYSYEVEKDGNRLLRLGGPQYERGFGDVLRMLQHVDMQPGMRYQLALDVKRTDSKATLLSAVCERWLIFPQNCAATAIKLQPADGAWHHYSVALPARRLEEGLLSAPNQIELASEGSNVFLDIDNVSLRDETGRELIRNGSFDKDNDYWFFSSDRNHFPWHVKNFPVNTFFEMGWLGSVALSLLVLYVAGSLAARGLHGDLYASASLAALAGFLIVGMFDSLFDVPRLTLLFFLVVCAASLLPARKPIVPGKRRRRVPEGEFQATGNA